MTYPRPNAFLFARKAHEGQTRKYTGNPYIDHPVAVARLLSDHLDSVNADMTAAAYLHDVVEDCNVTLAEIHGIFGPVVTNLVYWLTDTSTPADGNRAARKQIDRERLSNAPAAAQTIKVADLIDNTKSIVAFDPDFARTYLAEKKLLLAVLTRADPKIRALAYRQLSEAQAELAMTEAEIKERREMEVN